MALCDTAFSTSKSSIDLNHQAPNQIHNKGLLLNRMTDVTNRKPWNKWATAHLRSALLPVHHCCCHATPTQTQQHRVCKKAALLKLVKASVNAGTTIFPKADLQKSHISLQAHPAHTNGDTDQAMMVTELPQTLVSPTGPPGTKGTKPGVSAKPCPTSAKLNNF